MHGRHLDSSAAVTYMPPWQARITPVATRRGFNNPTPSVRSESTSHVSAMYCGQCGARMPHGDVGVCCATCRDLGVMRP